MARRRSGNSLGSGSELPQCREKASPGSDLAPPHHTEVPHSTASLNAVYRLEHCTSQLSQAYSGPIEVGGMLPGENIDLVSLDV